MSEKRVADRTGFAIAPEKQVGATWQTSRREIELSSPVVMGILNVTPDSFSDGGRFHELDDAVEQLDELLTSGADIVDVGGESTRPGAESVTVTEELERVLPVIETAARQTDVPISIDTTKSAVAQAALEAGAEIINDISGLRFDAGIADIAARNRAGLVLMHIRGRPRTMQRDIHYDDLLGEVISQLRQSANRALEAGCDRRQLVVDPGIGFGKTPEHNLTLINEVGRIGELGYPVLVGPSRKSFIGATLGLDVEDREDATVGACVVALLRGARIFRVHDVRRARRALDMASAIVRA